MTNCCFVTLIEVARRWAVSKIARRLLDYARIACLYSVDLVVFDSINLICQYLFSVLGWTGVKGQGVFSERRIVQDSRYSCLRFVA